MAEMKLDAQETERKVLQAEAKHRELDRKLASLCTVEADLSVCLEMLVACEKDKKLNDELMQ